MSLTEACLWSVCRAGLLALLTLPTAWQIAALLNRSAGVRRGLILVALLVPFLMPELLVGFVYSETTLRVVREFSDSGAEVVPPGQLRLPQAMDRPLNAADVVAELLYGLILLLRYAPVGVLAFWLTPGPRLSSESIHCRRLLLPREPGVARRCWLRVDAFARGPLAASLPAFAVVFLLVFQEFEIASLMQISRAPVAWTVWLFDNHAGGLLLSRSLVLAIVPLAFELLVVGAVFVLLVRGDWHARESLKPPTATGGWRDYAAVVFLLAGVIVVPFIPVVRLSSGLVTGLRGLFGQSGMLAGFAEELLTSLAFGVASALIAFQVSGWLLSRRRFRGVWVALCVLPGLIGSLVFSLVALAVFQLPGLNFAYDTPVPLLLVLSLYLLPRALLLHLVVFGRRAAEPEFAARLLASADAAPIVTTGREILFVLRTRPAIWIVCLLAYWGYWDLTVASILRPTMLEPFTPGLYNLMHYGRNETLAAMALVAGVVPLCLLGMLGGIRLMWRAVRS